MRDAPSPLRTPRAATGGRPTAAAAAPLCSVMEPWPGCPPASGRTNAACAAVAWRASLASCRGRLAPRLLRHPPCLLCITAVAALPARSGRIGLREVCVAARRPPVPKPRDASAVLHQIRVVRERARLLGAPHAAPFDARAVIVHRRLRGDGGAAASSGGCERRGHVEVRGGARGRSGPEAAPRVGAGEHPRRHQGCGARGRCACPSSRAVKQSGRVVACPPRPAAAAHRCHALCRRRSAGTTP